MPTVEKKIERKLAEKTIDEIIKKIFVRIAKSNFVPLSAVSHISRAYSEYAKTLLDLYESIAKSDPLHAASIQTTIAVVHYREKSMLLVDHTVVPKEITEEIRRLAMAPLLGTEAVALAKKTASDLTDRIANVVGLLEDFINANDELLQRATDLIEDMQRHLDRIRDRTIFDVVFNRLRIELRKSDLCGDKRVLENLSRLLIDRRNEWAELIGKKHWRVRTIHELKQCN